MAERMVFRKLNVTSAEDWKSVIKEAIGEYGRVDCLVNNAGTSYKNKVCISNQSSLGVSRRSFE